MFRSASESSWSLEVELDHFRGVRKFKNSPLVAAHRALAGSSRTRAHGDHFLQSNDELAVLPLGMAIQTLVDHVGHFRCASSALSRSSLVSLFMAYSRPSHITWATPTCSSSTIRERGTCMRSLPRRHGRRRNRSAPQVPLSLRHRLLLLRYDGQYIHQVSPVDSGGRQSSIARTPSPRVSLRRICFRACV